MYYRFVFYFFVIFSFLSREELISFVGGDTLGAMEKRYVLFCNLILNKVLVFSDFCWFLHSSRTVPRT